MMISAASTNVTNSGYGSVKSSKLSSVMLAAERSAIETSFKKNTRLLFMESIIPIQKPGRTRASESWIKIESYSSSRERVIPPAAPSTTLNTKA